MSEHEWQTYHPILPRRLTFTDGTNDRVSFAMRRRAPDGTWQYRRPTREEEWEEMETWAW